jgi:hypothetical protein
MYHDMLTRNLYNLENDGINQVNQMFKTRPAGYMVFLSRKTNTNLAGHNQRQFG